MTIEPTEFDLVALARRGLLVLIDEAETEREFARRFSFVDSATRQLTLESVAARAKVDETAQAAYDRLARFNVLYPESVSS